MNAAESNSTAINNVRHTVNWIGVLAALAMVLGGTLLYKGFQSGELLIGIAGSMGGALAGMIAMRSTPPTGPGGGIQVEGTPTPSRPVITEPENTEPK